MNDITKTTCRICHKLVNYKVIDFKLPCGHSSKTGVRCKICDKVVEHDGLKLLCGHSTTCNYDIAYVGWCGGELEKNETKCNKHKNLKCVYCGKSAMRECPRDMGYCVCGEPICWECNHIDKDIQGEIQKVCNKL